MAYLLSVSFRYHSKLYTVAVLRGGQGGHGPQKFSWLPNFLGRYGILNMEYFIYCKYLRITRYCILTYTKSVSSFLCFEMYGKFRNVNGDLASVFSVMLSCCILATTPPPPTSIYVQNITRYSIAKANNSKIAELKNNQG